MSSDSVFFNPGAPKHRRGESMIYDLTCSGIDGNGFQYICGMLEPKRLDNRNLQNGKAFSFNIYHPKNKTELWTFEWVHGAPHNWKQIATFNDEIIVESEVESILRKYGLLKEDLNENQQPQ